MAQDPPISSRQGPGQQQWLSKYGVVGRPVLGALGIPTFKQPVNKIPSWYQCMSRLSDKSSINRS